MTTTRDQNRRVISYSHQKLSATLTHPSQFGEVKHECSERCRWCAAEVRKKGTLDTEIRRPFLFLSEINVVLYLRDIAYSMVSLTIMFFFLHNVQSMYECISTKTCLRCQEHKLCFERECSSLGALWHFDPNEMRLDLYFVD